MARTGKRRVTIEILPLKWCADNSSHQCPVPYFGRFCLFVIGNWGREPKRWRARSCDTGSLPQEPFLLPNVADGSHRSGVEAEMRAAARLTFFLSCLALSFGWARAAPAQTNYNWSDIDCRQSHIASWPGLRCKATNVVTTDGNVGAYRRWSAYGTTSEGYFHIFLWEAQNSFSYINVDQTTAEFLKWMYENGRSADQFSPVARYHEVDYSTFRDDKRTCAGFRRTGNQRRGG